MVRAALKENGLAEAPPSLPSASLEAAFSVVADLVNQGWELTCEATEIVVRPPVVNGDPTAERDRVRKQELLKRDEQLRRESVRRFVARMETPRRRGTSTCPSSTSCATAVISRPLYAYAISVTTSVPGQPVQIDPVLAVAATLLAFELTLAAGLAPARRAARLDPMSALRS